MISVQLNNISLIRNKTAILDNLDLDLSSKDFTLMTGQNGSGKSTLLKVLSGLLKADQFSMKVDQQFTGLNTEAKQKSFLRENFCYLHQTPYLFSGNVYNNIAYGLKYKDLSKYEIDNRVNEALDIVGLGNLGQRKSHALSGGEKQRVAIARSWVIKPSFILLDEPFANMDKHSRKSAYKTINKLHQEKIGIIITSHDPHHGELNFNRHLHLYQGKMTENTIEIN